ELGGAGAHEQDGAGALKPGFYVFDCIEFSLEFRCNDVASEIAFLAMDLTGHGRQDLAERLVATYGRLADDRALAALMPFYACLRAAVRAKVNALQSEEADVEPGARRECEERARRHFALAARYAWSATQPFVIACAGPSGSGKTALAAEIARATGFAHL